MIKIDKMKLRLPPELQHRAVFIARLIGDQLSSQISHKQQNREIEQISISGISVSPHTPAREIANAITHQINKSLNSRGSDR